MIRTPRRATGWLLLLALLGSAALADRLQLRNGQTVEGQFLGYDGQTIVFRGATGFVSLPRTEVAAIFLGEAQPTGGNPFTVGPGLSVSGWVTIKRLKTWSAKETPVFSAIRMSADGSTIALASYQGTFVMNTDGSDYHPVATKRNSNGLVDLSADGRKIAWMDDDGTWVANKDGSGKLKLPGGYSYVEHLRITADGRTIFLRAQTPGAVFRIPADGSGLKQIANTDQCAGLLKEKSNRNFWTRCGMDISDDGSRVAFGFHNELFTVGGDGQGLRLIEPRGQTHTDDPIVVSGDGSTIAIHSTYGPGANQVRMMNFDGSNLVSYGDYKSTRFLDLSRDGSVCFGSWGLVRLTRDGQGELWPIHTNDGIQPPPLYRLVRGVSSADGKRVAMLSVAADRTQGEGVVLVDLNPPTISGVPMINNIRITPTFLLTDQSSNAVLTYEVTGQDVKHAQVSILRDGVQRLQFTYYDSLKLSDDGKKGSDEKAGDGTFTTDQLRVYKAGKIPPGPLTTRCVAYDDAFNMLLVDVEGLEARQP